MSATADTEWRKQLYEECSSMLRESQQWLDKSNSTLLESISAIETDSSALRKQFQRRALGDKIIQQALKRKSERKRTFTQKEEEDVRNVAVVEQERSFIEEEKKIIEEEKKALAKEKEALVLAQVEAEKAQFTIFEAEKLKLQAEKARMEVEKLEIERLRFEMERQAQEARELEAKSKAEAEKIELEKRHAAKLEQEALEKLEKARMEAEQAKNIEKEEIAAMAIAKQFEIEKAGREEAEKMKAITEKAIAEKMAAEKALAEKLAVEKSLAEQLAKEKALAEKALAEKVEAEKALAEKIQAEKAATEKVIAEKIAIEKALAEKEAAGKALEEKLAAEKALSEKLAIEKAQEKAAKEKAEKEAKEREERELAEKDAREKAEKKAAAAAVAGVGATAAYAVPKGNELPPPEVEFDEEAALREALEEQSRLEEEEKLREMEEERLAIETALAQHAQLEQEYQNETSEIVEEEDGDIRVVEEEEEESSQQPPLPPQSSSFNEKRYVTLQDTMTMPPKSNMFGLAKNQKRVLVLREDKFRYFDTKGNMLGGLSLAEEGVEVALKSYKKSPSKFALRFSSPSTETLLFFPADEKMAKKWISGIEHNMELRLELPDLGPEEATTYYDYLGISPDQVDNQVLLQAYADRSHSAHDEFLKTKLKEALNVLTDPFKRVEYDNFVAVQQKFRFGAPTSVQVKTSRGEVTPSIPSKAFTDSNFLCLYWQDAQLGASLSGKHLFVEVGRISEVVPGANNSVHLVLNNGEILIFTFQDKRESEDFGAAVRFAMGTKIVREGGRRTALKEDQV